MVGTFLALSECYPAWAKTLSSESSASWFLLAFMIMRRHAPNALWLQGYNYSLSDWHSRDCKRDSCCKCCRRGKGKEEMINYISHVIHKMLYFLDHLNAEGIKMVWLHLQEDELEEDYYRVWPLNNVPSRAIKFLLPLVCLFYPQTGASGRQSGTLPLMKLPFEPLCASISCLNCRAAV